MDSRVPIRNIVAGVAFLGIMTASFAYQQVPPVEELKNNFTALKLTVTQQSETISAVSLTSPPVGAIVAFAGLLDKNHVPKDWLICDGSPLSKTAYPELWSVIGTAYGDGRDDQDQKVPNYDFNLPDLRGNFLRGLDTSGLRDPDVNQRIRLKTGGNSGALVGSF